MLVLGALEMFCFFPVSIEWIYFYKKSLGHVLHLESLHWYIEYPKISSAVEVEGSPSLTCSFTPAKSCRKCREGKSVCYTHFILIIVCSQRKVINFHIVGNYK